ncbi:MAG TPA: ABC transporter ATP-binding protein [Spirochaetia bacterium]|nr:ABC transporter ATP-binding protein [Spirochaetia bacterium]
MSDPDDLLVIDQVGKTYRTASEELPVLHSISMKMRRGEVISITGESGSGKTTLLSLIAGLDSPTRGVIRCGGYEVSGLTEAGLTEYRSRTVGLIFQLHYLLKDFTAIENVLIPAFMAGTAKDEAKEWAGDLLRQVNLYDRRDHYPMQLSGGERQRVAVARAMVNHPHLLLADEPTGNLDERNSRVVEELLLELVRSHATSLILVTHDAALAERAGGRHLSLESGELLTV